MSSSGRVTRRRPRRKIRTITWSRTTDRNNNRITRMSWKRTRGRMRRRRRMTRMRRKRMALKLGLGTGQE